MEKQIPCGNDSQNCKGNGERKCKCNGGKCNGKCKGNGRQILRFAQDDNVCRGWRGEIPGAEYALLRTFAQE